jgi:hypothetical protein
VTTALLAPARQRAPVRRFVALVVVATVALRLIFLRDPIHPDEAGFLLVAKDWHLGGPFLYGHYWVDRPPGLIAIYRLASLSSWPLAIRVLTIPFVALFVVSAAWASYVVAGERSARWSALVGGALMVSPLLDTQVANGELFAAALVMLTIALTLAAMRRPASPSYLLAFLAGLTGGLAVTVKQNFGDGIVFAVVLVVASLVQRRMRLPQAWRTLLAGVLGGAVVVAGNVAYTVVARVGVGQLWFDLYGFRTRAMQIIIDRGLTATIMRAEYLLLFAVLSGMVPILLLLAREAWRCQLTGSPVAWAVAATVVVELVSIAGGGSYWPHYLLQLAPTVAFAAGLWAPEIRWLKGLGAFVVVSALVSTTITAFAPEGHAGRTSKVGTEVGNVLAAASRPGDTATMLYGHQDAQLASGLRSPYPYFWSLPLRTLDPHEAQLRAVLAGPHAPTWVVVWSGLDWWRIDREDRTRLDLATHYHFAGRVCGHGFWLHDGLQRHVPAVSGC